jgi:katanin p60 ATPase-containing subunit A1
MDGLIAGNTDVFVLACSNLPWDLDAAFLRRMEKRVFIPLPEKHARKEMMKSHLLSFPLEPAFHNDKNDIFDAYATQTEGFSGSDIRTLCKEVSMRPLRRMLTQLEQSDTLVDQSLSLLMKKNPITVGDFDESLAAMSQSADAQLCKRHKAWSESHGSA